MAKTPADELAEYNQLMGLSPDGLSHIGSFDAKTFDAEKFASEINSGARSLESIAKTSPSAAATAKTLEKHFVEIPDPGKYRKPQGFAPLKLSDDLLTHSAQAKNLGMSDANKPQLKEIGIRGHEALDEIEKNLTQQHELLTQHHTEELLKIEAAKKAQIKTGTFTKNLTVIDPAKADAYKAKLDADLAKAKEKLDARKALIDAERKELLTHTGEKHIPDPAVKLPAAAASEAVAAANKVKWSDVVSKSAKGQLFSEVKGFTAEAAKIEREAKFDKMGVFRRQTAKISGNIGGGNWAKRGIAVAGTGSAIYFGAGLLGDIGRVIGFVPNKTNEKGEEQKVGFTDFVIDGGMTAASLLVAGIGGKGHAMRG